MEERSASDVSDRAADLLSGMNHIHTKCVHCIPANVIPIDTGDQDLALVIIHEQAPNHLPVKLTY